MAAVVASLVQHPSLRLVLLPSLDGHRRCSLLPWAACRMARAGSQPLRSSPCCWRRRPLFRPVTAAACAAAVRPYVPPAPTALPLPPPAPRLLPRARRSQLYIAALNVLIGISRAPHLEVRAVTYHGIGNEWLDWLRELPQDG